MLISNISGSPAAVMPSLLPPFPRLRKTFGVVDSLIILAIDDECRRKPHEENGCIWCRMSYVALSEAADCSTKTIQRALPRLVSAGVLMRTISKTFNEGPHDRTRSYRLDHGRIAECMTAEMGITVGKMAQLK